MKLTLNPEISYITVLASARHVNAEDWAVIARAAADVFFIHATTTLEPGYIVRFGAAGGYEWDETEFQLKDLGLSADFIALAEAMFKCGYDAAHFDVDGNMLDTVPYYTESGSKVTPLAADLPLLSWDDLDDAQRATAEADYLPYGETVENYFIENGTYFFAVPASDDNDASLYCMADVMRTDGELEEEGFTGVISESAFSSVVVMLSDDSDFISVYRLTN